MSSASASLTGAPASRQRAPDGGHAERALGPEVLGRIGDEGVPEVERDEADHEAKRGLRFSRYASIASRGSPVAIGLGERVDPVLAPRSAGRCCASARSAPSGAGPRWARTRGCARPAPRSPRRSPAGGATRFTSPHSSACSAVTGSPVSRISAARPGPTMPGRSAASITEGTPTRISGRPRSAPGGRDAQVAGHRQLEARAQARAVDHAHGRERRVVYRLIASCRRVMNALAVAGVSSRSTWSCMPPVVARPAPVITAARTAGSRAERVEGGADPLDHLGHDQVQRRPVEGDPGAAALALDANDSDRGHQ